MKWEVGDIAICINTSYVGHKDNSHLGGYPPLRLNAEYIVGNVYECVKCKRLSLDVGLSDRNSKAIRCICNNPLLNNGAYWCASERFKKKESFSEQEEMEKLEINQLIK